MNSDTERLKNGVSATSTCRRASFTGLVICIEIPDLGFPSALFSVGATIRVSVVAVERIREGKMFPPNSSFSSNVVEGKILSRRWKNATVSPPARIRRARIHIMRWVAPRPILMTTISRLFFIFLRIYEKKIEVVWFCIKRNAVALFLRERQRLQIYWKSIDSTNKH